MIEEQKQDVPEADLVAQGLQKIRWAEMHQRLLQRLRMQFSETKPFAGLTIGPQPVPGEINATVASWMVENLSHRGSEKR